MGKVPSFRETDRSPPNPPPVLARMLRTLAASTGVDTRHDLHDRADLHGRLGGDHAVARRVDRADGGRRPGGAVRARSAHHGGRARGAHGPVASSRRRVMLIGWCWQSQSSTRRNGSTSPRARRPDTSNELRRGHATPDRRVSLCHFFAVRMLAWLGLTYNSGLGLFVDQTACG